VKRIWGDKCYKSNASEQPKLLSTPQPTDREVHKLFLSLYPSLRATRITTASQVAKALAVAAVNAAGQEVPPLSYIFAHAPHPKYEESLHKNQV